MVEVRLEHVTKRFDDVVAADDVCLDIGEGRFFTLLGPSGCGKTTVLRIIAGFTRQDEGDVFFGDELINDVPPHRRNTGLVFQTYALWPHMRVFDNVGFGLDFLGGVGREEKRRRVLDILDLVDLEGLENRFPSQLSGGQQQRVALARALVVEPRVLLLDEPLSNLDAKLRVQMRAEIKGIQRRLGITAIYVTHDQEEALSVSDEIAVLEEGAVRQVGSPRSIYEEPENSFVAGFIGLANFLEGRISEVDGSGLRVGVVTEEGISLEADLEAAVGWSPGSHVVASLRPEAITIQRRSAFSGSSNRVDGRVRFASYLGNRVRYEVESSWGGVFRVDVYNPRHEGVLGEGEEVSLSFAGEDIRLIKLG